MSKIFYTVCGVVILGLSLLALSSCGSNLQSKVDELKQIAGPPPTSLDQYFPPKAQAPVYLIEMFTLAGPLEGIGVDLQEQDMAGVKTNFQAFQTQYNKVSKMVPEWTSRFPEDPVTALGKAIDSGNQAQIGPAMGKVGEVCGSCHLIYQVKVQQQYHWKNFDDIKVKDPVTAQSMSFGDYMTAMAGAYSGIAIDLQEGQTDNARKNFQAFNARFDTLATDACKECHVDPSGKEIPRKYFVDDSMKAIINQLGQALAAPAPDAQSIQQLSGAIGNDACLNCHLVHLPAQNAKDTWENFADLFK
jgi:hypothetical protein